MLLGGDTNEGSKLAKDLKKENLRLSKKLAKASKKLRSRSQPPSTRFVTADEEDEEDVVSDEGPDLDSDDTDKSRSTRGRRKKGKPNFVKRRHSRDSKTKLDVRSSIGS